jgi:UDP-hydrolysing UDP-N-acetyl-D-glucosamine 2-epimerase
MRKKIVTVTTGTRADYGILRPLLKRINRSKNLELFLIVTGSHLSKNHGNTIQEIIKDGFNINTKINIVPKKDDSLNTSIAIGESIIKFSRYFNKIKPDFNIVFGDRYEMLSSTIAAYNQNILNVHIHGGDKSGGLDEYTRHAITKMSNIHFPATVKSATRIKKMGENPKYIIKSGSLSIDEIIEKKISTLRELNLKYNLDLTGNEIIILQHPDTTEPNKSKEQIVATLKAVIKTKHNAIIIGPNMDTGNNSINKTIKLFSKNNSLKFFSSLPREDYLGLLKNCKLLIGNSSSGIIESTIFKIPVINIGDRQKGREHGPNVINVKKFSQKLISKSLEKSLLMNKSNLRIKNIYGNGRTAKKIVEYLEKINLDQRLLKKEIRY